MVTQTLPLKSAHLACLTALLTLFLSGCSGDNSAGSGNFFDDPPDCYYDVLFGCGTFDIPGNSSYYGYNRAALKAKIMSRPRPHSSLDFSGEWYGYLDRKSSSCNFATIPKVQGNFSVKQLNNRVTVRLPSVALRSYPLRGPATKKGFEATTSGLYSFCSFSLNSKLNSSDGHSGVLEIRARVKCPLQKSCEIRYQGETGKQRNIPTHTVILRK